MIVFKKMKDGLDKTDIDKKNVDIDSADIIIIQIKRTNRYVHL